MVEPIEHKDPLLRKVEDHPSKTLPPDTSSPMLTVTNMGVSPNVHHQETSILHLAIHHS
jgi:hypothetical protein